MLENAAFIAICSFAVFLSKLRRAIVYMIIPMAIMLTMSVWAMVLSLIGFCEEGKWSLAGVSIIVLAMSFWLAVEAVMSFARGRDGFEDDELAAIDAAHS